MVTNSHTMTSLANFLAPFRHCEAKIFGYRSVPKPLRMESDFSWPFVLATLKEFNGESFSEFLERAWRMATKSCLKRDSNMVNPHICSSHVMHDISLQCKKRCNGAQFPFAMHTFALLVNALTLEHADAYIVHMYQVMCSKYANDDSITSYKSLKEAISNLGSNRAANSVKKELNKFADWILSFVPEPIKKTVNKQVDSLKEKVNRIFMRGERLTLKEKQTALKGYLKTYRIDGQKGIDFKTFLSKIKPKVLDLINQQKKPVKVKFIFTLELTDQFQNQGSGWQFDQVEYFDINIDPFEPLSGSSYIRLPSKLASKKAIINVKNEDDHECFKWAVTSAVYPREKDPQRQDEQMRVNSRNFDWSGIEFPVLQRQIDKFEKQNPYAINVFGYKGDVYPLIVSKKHEARVINLLHIENDETKHYCWIKNLKKLVSNQIDKFRHFRFLCYRCLNPFRCKQSLEKHREYCCNHEEVKPVMPKDKDGNPLHTYFKNYTRKMRVPSVVYADFESFTENIDTCSPDESKSFTKQYQKHKPSGFCYLIKCFDDNIFPSELVRYTAESPDEDIPQMFIENLESDIKKIYNTFKFPKKVKMSKKDKITYNNATHCHICEDELGEDKIVVDSFTNKEGKQVDVKRDIRFVDSFKFMASSLDSLADNLTKCGKCESCKPDDCLKRYIKDGE
ncbi:predicted protein [Nematostella vectensis]|uniref:C2H2-type domain-containing protein n=1 Tax=Nematostella vectensis TaxID=45351 RepID=A7T371_NEMVE|nr:predicted protein [Nematostella vectensis]|eukprot:XP_001621694.1 hypothetical protein NEMVEDRAFT_v1g248650 [Nematostella vectensis]